MIRTVFEQFKNKQFKLTLVENGHKKTFNNSQLHTYDNTDMITLNGIIYKHIQFRDIKNLKNNVKTVTFEIIKQYKTYQTKEKFILHKIKE